MSTATVPCPHCTKQVGQSRESQGREVACPHCQQPFFMPVNLEGIGWFDRQLIAASGCAVIALCLLFNGAALVVGIIGLCICKHPIARKRAAEMATVGGVITAFAVVLVAGAVLLSGV